jgi:hypothetical protein
MREAHFHGNGRQEYLLSWIDKLLPNVVGKIPPISRTIYK